MLLSGLYLVLVALAAFGLGGYVAGRMRPPVDAGDATEFQDGMYGLLVWGIATLIAGSSRRHSAIGTTHSGGSRCSIGGRYVCSRRKHNRVTTWIVCSAVAKDDPAATKLHRAKAARILCTTSSHSGMDPSDRAYLARLGSADTGLAQDISRALAAL